MDRLFAWSMNTASISGALTTGYAGSHTCTHTMEAYTEKKEFLSVNKSQLAGPGIADV